MKLHHIDSVSQAFKDAVKNVGVLVPPSDVKHFLFETLLASLRTQDIDSVWIEHEENRRWGLALRARLGEFTKRELPKYEVRVGLSRRHLCYELSFQEDPRTTHLLDLEHTAMLGLESTGRQFANWIEQQRPGSSLFRAIALAQGDFNVLSKTPITKIPDMIAQMTEQRRLDAEAISPL